MSCRQNKHYEIKPISSVFINVLRYRNNNKPLEYFKYIDNILQKKILITKKNFKIINIIILTTLKIIAVQKYLNKNVKNMAENLKKLKILFIILLHS